MLNFFIGLLVGVVAGSLIRCGHCKHRRKHEAVTGTMTIKPKITKDE